MSNKIYPNTAPFAHERNTNVNFNYVWDETTSHWIPQVQSSLTSDYILNNAKATIHKFGSNPDVDQNVSITSPETIWDGSNQYEFPDDAGESIRMVSSDNADNQDIVIEGLDENFEVQIWQGALSGITEVTIPYTWTRVYRAFNNGSSDLVGDLSIYKSGDTSKEYAKILDGNNQTLMSVYTIPSDCKGYLIKYQCTAYNPQSASEIGYTLHMCIRQFGKVFRTQSITSVGTSHAISQEFPFPLEIPPKSDILFNVVSSNGNNGAINADFDIALLPV